MPVILATQEAEIRGIMVQSQPAGQIVHKALSQKTHQKKSNRSLFLGWRLKV
jgi:hypothetical protein